MWIVQCLRLREPGLHLEFESAYALLKIRIGYLPSKGCSIRTLPAPARCPFVLVDNLSNAYLDPSLESP